MPLSSGPVRRRGRFDLAVVSTFVATPHDHLDELPVSADRMDAYAAAGPNPWHAFTGYIHAICAIQAADRGFADALTMTFPAAPGPQRLRRTHRPGQGGRTPTPRPHRPGRDDPAHGRHRRGRRDRRRRTRRLTAPGHADAARLHHPTTPAPPTAGPSHTHGPAPGHGPLGQVQAHEPVSGPPHPRPPGRPGSGRRPGRAHPRDRGGSGPADDGEAFGPHMPRHTHDLVRGEQPPTRTDKARALEALTTDRRAWENPPPHPVMVLPTPPRTRTGRTSRTPKRGPHINSPRHTITAPPRGRPHILAASSRPRWASLSARSLPSSPLCPRTQRHSTS